jgi:hypothetical protein
MDWERKTRTCPALSRLGTDTARPSISGAFLPAIYQGTQLASRRLAGASEGTTTIQIPNIKIRGSTTSPAGATRLHAALNHMQRENYQPDVEGVIESYRLAFRMQDELPQLMDLNDESKATLDLYGIDSATDSFGRNACATVWRKGFVSWKSAMETGITIAICPGISNRCNEIDKPIAGLLEDPENTAATCSKTPSSSGRRVRPAHRILKALMAAT